MFEGFAAMDGGRIADPQFDMTKPDKGRRTQSLSLPVLTGSYFRFVGFAFSEQA
jgi:hypothetical protein